MATASIRAVRELGWDGKANRSELLINVVRKERAKEADRLGPKAAIRSLEMAAARDEGCREPRSTTT
jgi:hypothetical protein